MFISMMFAGHHTTSGTAAWTLIELLRHPDELAAVDAELDELYADGAEVSYQALREMPRLESAIKEALRLHPPLILLLRVAKEDLEVEGYRIAAGKLVGAQPGRLEPHPRGLPRPRRLRPRAATSSPAPRTAPTRGRGSPSAPAGTAASARAFAMMQLKAIFSVLLRDWEFELAQPLGHLPQRPLEDGRAARSSPAWSRYRRRGRGGAGAVMESWSTATCARATASASPRRPTVFSVSKKGELDRPRRDAARGAARRGRGGRAVLPHPRPVASRRTDDAMPHSRATSSRRWSQRWLDANRRAEEAGDWKPMAEMYTEDATYGWNIGPNEEFMAVGRDEIREHRARPRDGRPRRLDLPVPEGPDRRRSRARSSACGSRSPTPPGPTARHYEIAGLGGSWFRYAGNFQWSWQRDFFDVGNATAALHRDDQGRHAAPTGMQQRMERATSGERLPGHYRLGQAPVDLWD